MHFPSQSLDESVSLNSQIHSYFRSSTRWWSLWLIENHGHSQWWVFRRSWMRNGAPEFFLLFSFFPLQWIAATTRKALFIVQRSQRITRFKSVRSAKNERPSTLPFESQAQEPADIIFSKFTVLLHSCRQILFLTYDVLRNFILFEILKL